uniref:Uncharacterized protein n=1 Tax=Arundo donax TaxID=35708 RepID=A0A0A9B5S0_ARUDO
MCRFAAVYSIDIHKNGLHLEDRGSNSLALVSGSRGQRRQAKSGTGMRCFARSPVASGAPTGAHDLPSPNSSATTNSRAHERTGARASM